MTPKWRRYILWSVLSLGLLACAVDAYESPFARRTTQLLKLGASGSKPSRLSSAGGGGSSRRPHPRPGEPEAQIQPESASLPDVSVTCSASDLVVRVKPAFYGLGAAAEELTLGAACRSNGLLRPYGDLLFTYPLTACGAVRQSLRGYLVYKFALHYEPLPTRFPSSAHRIDVDIECRYQRNHHVYQLTVRPTWETAVLRRRLTGSQSDFQLELMDDSWSRAVESRLYQLGEAVNFQVSAPHVPAGGKVYINSCYATLSSDSKSSLKYTIIDNLGCMIDSKRDTGASRFISRTDKTLRFSLKAFQFISDPDTEVTIRCRLFVASGDPDPAHKSCSYSGNRWKALTGDDSICECCDSQCVTSKPRRAMMEGSASSVSFLVSDQPYTAEDGFLPASPSSVSRRGEGEPIIDHFIELQSHENPWESVDEIMYDDDDEQEHIYTEEEGELDDDEEEEEESGVIHGVMTEPDLDELGFRERVSAGSDVTDSNQSEEDGSWHRAQESEEEDEGFEGRGDETSDAQRHWVTLEQMLPSGVSPERKLQPVVSEGEAEWKNDDSLAGLNNTEMTWYFTWSN